jgi:hypothetical protein
MRWGVYWIDLAEDKDKWLALVNEIMTLTYLQSAGKHLTNRETIGFSARTLLHGIS